MTHLFSIPTLPNSSAFSLRSLRFDHLHEPGYKNPKLYKQSDCRSGAYHTRYRRRRIQKLVTRASPWFTCNNFWQVRRTTRQDVETYRANHLQLPKSRDHGGSEEPYR
jgi:hypothetical protein